MPSHVTFQYEALVAAGEIERDPAQERVLGMLGDLEARLGEHRLARKSSALGWLFAARERKAEPIRGLYLHGDVGRGKTMLMDLFCRRRRRYGASVARISTSSWATCTSACGSSARS